MNEKIKIFNDKCGDLSIDEILQQAFKLIEGEKSVSFSGQIEDVALIEAVTRLKLASRFYTLDTGRLHEETYKIMDKVKFRYEIDLEVFFPLATDIRKMTQENGLYAFKQSVQERKKCCLVRKVLPNKLALKNTKLWINGLRREQAASRTNIDFLSFDEDLNVWKLSPLLNWTWQQVLDYAQEKKLYKNTLYDQGYPSIGCEPCTRAIVQGEDLRAGRWWWENADQKECGLHA